MTSEELKQRLSEYRNILEDIDSLSRQREELEQIATAIRSSLSESIRGSGISRKTEKAAMLIAEIDERIDAKLDELKQKEEAVNALLDLLAESAEKSIIRYRHINGLTFDTIAEKVHYSRRWCIELYKNGVEKIIKLQNSSL